MIVADAPGDGGEAAGESSGDTPKHPSSTTRSSVGGEPAPRLPHERDESSDAAERPIDADVMQKAHDDVERGVAPTDRGEQTNEVYARTLRNPTPGADRDDAGRPPPQRRR